MGSNQTKPKSGQNSNLGSETSTFQAIKINSRKPHKISSVYFESEEHQIWECDSQENSKDRNSDGRSRSQGNSSELEPNYSRSIKEVLKC